MKGDLKVAKEVALKPGFRKRSDALILALIAAKNEAFELQLYGTAHAIDGAMGPRQRLGGRLPTL